MNFMDSRLPEAFWSKAIPEPNSGCWLWTAGCTAAGYSRFLRKYGHRASYEALVGPIPEGLQIDHLCRERSCVNPAHLEPVTCRENVMRGMAPLINASLQLSKTHCPKGHEYTASNTYVKKNQNGNPRRACRTCELVWAKAKYAGRS